MDDIEGPVKPVIEEPQRKSRGVNLLDTFRFEDEEDYEDEINLKFCFFFSRVFSWKIDTPESFILLFSHQPDRKIIKLLTFDDLFPSLCLVRHSR